MFPPCCLPAQLGHWDDLRPKLGVPQSKMLEIQRLYWTDHQRMEALVDDYITYHSSPIWKEFAAALRGWSYTSKADEVTTKFVKGMDANHVTCLILIPTVDGQLVVLNIKLICVISSPQ